jgi:hypothetical protein
MSIDRGHGIATSSVLADSYDLDALISDTEAAKVAALAAQAASELALDTFDDRYLGAKAADPTVDNDGNALIDGAMYFDTTLNITKIYDLATTAWKRTTPTTADQTNIDTVSAKATEIGRLGTVAAVADMAILGTADVVTDMNTLGTADVVTDMNTLGTADVVLDMNTLGTAGNVTNMNTLAGISANITTVAGISANTTTVAGIAANVTSVAGNATNINSAVANAAAITTVATNIADVSKVADDIVKVVAVANDLAEAISEVETVANDLNEATSEIDTVATNIANVNTVGGISADVTTVAGISANVTTVAGISANVTSVAGNSTNINAVAADATDIGIVAAANTNIGLVGGSITNVNEVANNLGSVNAFGEQYRVAATAPTTSLDAGDLWFDTTANTMKVYTGSGFANAGSSVNGIENSVEHIATAGQTSFTATYDAGFLNVFLNGVKLDSTDYTATTGSTVVLDTGAALNDSVFIQSFGTFTLADHYSKTASDARFEPIDSAYTKAESDAAYEPLDATIVKDADIGVTVQGYDATIVVDADIGVTVQAYDATYLVDADIGTTVLSPTGDGSGLTGLVSDPTMGGDLSGLSSNAQIVANAVGTTEIANSAVTDAKIAGMSSSKLSGALPAIDGSALTGMSSAAIAGQAWLEYVDSTAAFRGYFAAVGAIGTNRAICPFNNSIDPHSMFTSVGSNSFVVNTSGLYTFDAQYAGHNHMHMIGLYLYNSTDNTYATKPNATFNGTSSVAGSMIGYGETDDPTHTMNDIYYLSSTKTYTIRYSGDTNNAALGTSNSLLFGNYTVNGVTQNNILLRGVISKLGGY